MELLKSSIFADCSTRSIARARRSIRIASPDLAVRLAAAGFVIVLAGSVPCASVRWSRRARSTNPIDSQTRTHKNAGPCGTAHRSVRAGDPQTYALLHCSVFKVRTLPPGPFRTGSLTAPKGRGVRVNEG